MLEVTDAKYQEQYKIWVQFNNGVSGIIDLENDLWGSVFAPLKIVENFKKFSVSKNFKTIVWENEADFAPEFLYSKLPEQVRKIS